MSGVRFDPDEVEAERKVVGEERAREMESPQARLDQTHQTVSYLRHPYRNPVLGWPEDVARIGVEELQAFYRTITGPTARCSSWPATSTRHGPSTGSRTCSGQSPAVNRRGVHGPGTSRPRRVAAASTRTRSAADSRARASAFWPSCIESPPRGNSLMIVWLP